MTVGEEAKVELRDYLRAIRKRWWWLPAAVALVVGLAALVTFQTPPQYATTTTFFIGTPHSGITDAYQGNVFSEKRVTSYASLLTGDRLAAAVSEQLGVGLSPDEVQRRITAQPVPDTVLLRAVVTDGSKVRSELIAHVLAKQFAKMVELLETPVTAGTPTSAAADGATSAADRKSTVKIEVIGGPRLDPKPVSPRPVRDLGLAVLFGLLLGVGAAVLREVTDTTVKSSEALQELAGAPVLATIPHDSMAPRVPLVSGRAAGTGRGEALRQLRTNLQFVDVDRPVRVIVVTSAVPSEGKSSTAVNLAIVFAETGQRVLIIDADLRRPKLAEYLGIEGAVGLTNLLAGQAQADDVIQRWGSHLWALPSGFQPPNPSELLASRQMADLLQALRERFDVIVIDSPPLLPVTDGAVMAACADGALLVARATKTHGSQITGALRALEAVNARLLGCALNMVPGMKSDYYYSSYYSNNHRSAQAQGEERSEVEAGNARAVPSTAPAPAAAEHASVAPPQSGGAEVVDAPSRAAEKATAATPAR